MGFFKLKVTKELVQELGREMHQGTFEGSHGRVMKFFTKCPWVFCQFSVSVTKVRKPCVLDADTIELVI